jgi:hypothetical protein
MTSIIPIGLSLPKEIISKIDTERGDISRSKYLLRILEGFYSIRKQSESLNNGDAQESYDDGVKMLTSYRSMNSQDVFPTSQGLTEQDIDSDLCQAVGCSKRATIKYAVKAGPSFTISLSICKDCVYKFEDPQSSTNQHDQIGAAQP